MNPRPLARLVGATLFLGLVLSTVPAAADSLSVLTERVDRLTRDLADLRNQFYLTQSNSGGSPQAIAPGQAGSIETRLAAFEQELRNLTGTLEQLNHGQAQLNGRMDRMQADVEYRLTTLEGGTPQASTGQSSMGTSGSTVGAVAPINQSASVATTSTDVASATQGDVQTLGTVAESEVASVQGGVAAPQPVTPQVAAPAAVGGTATLPAGTPQQQYDYAFGLLRQANYDAAEQALTAFVQQNPGDPLAANAKYWLGETYYVRGNYNEAARAFGVAYQEHPNGPKATDSLLKLGLSLSLLGRNTDACAVFVELEGRYPDAAANVLQRSKQERGRLGC